MADGVTINPGSGGAKIATDDVGGEHYQRVKLAIGADGVADDISAAKASELAVIMRLRDDDDFFLLAL